MATLEDYGYQRTPLKVGVCLSDTWETIKPQYWLFFGMAFVASLIYGTVIFLAGPMLAGFSWCIDRARRDEELDFSKLFYGFESPHVGGTFVISLVYFAVVMVMVFASYFITLVGMFGMMGSAGAMANGGANGDAAVATGAFLMTGGFCCFGGALGIFSMLAQFWMIFALMLILDRKAPMGEAMSLAFVLTFRHFWALTWLGIVLLLLVTLGSLACFVGIFFVYPIFMGAPVLAYRTWFRDGNWDPDVYADSQMPPLEA